MLVLSPTHTAFSSINLNDLILVILHLLIKLLQSLHDLLEERRRCLARHSVANLPHDARLAAGEPMFRGKPLQLSKFLVVEGPI